MTINRIKQRKLPRSELDVSFDITTVFLYNKHRRLTFDILNISDTIPYFSTSKLTENNKTLSRYTIVHHNLRYLSSMIFHIDFACFHNGDGQ